ncbi:hypothetical protein NZD89_28645 (plasmid) [Alicyclobacillus fastidiosus]|uniref:Uncharacterized protein n=1 Tax=Alicyclobacillus fastidiosus TaxID=392011 RepID=A0ABY6ZRP2_9BACL|nr:hypothetical protein [Alicyclobacillus fastidiosus]WAH44826.1 hypothetical protein NZD89_28645 [Alicyclobacillus fastidiosus]GMA65791.1 hypothetical protein GCM10025859_62310 [Alicyclobacillus fastidiosus]GMA65863.1 hypothetical protein GCM10025859_63040 [Alicyclobacillus fastidiosus]
MSNKKPDYKALATQTRRRLPHEAFLGSPGEDTEPSEETIDQIKEQVIGSEQVNERSSTSADEPLSDGTNERWSEGAAEQTSTPSNERLSESVKEQVSKSSNERSIDDEVGRYSFDLKRKKHRALKSKCAMEGKTISEVLDRLIDSYLQEN